ncbi:hypothetical protein EUX98_g5277 [Antrodiella citrinella]|uniref:FAD-binding PCMH-type domain-containing protein n=1 Tax=Antrodiella citrinella TaxID=2447956 RepID=A0A4S4MSW2_9APHY|nr:hypothetical protein EUX98_g5277 [Antrodiella citrinella]
MTRFNQIKYNPRERLVEVGAGLVWDDVYAALNPLGANVVGGRATGLGVAGLSLGGGYSYISNQYGLAIDNIVAYELVLPNGSVKTITNSSNAELFFALRGGSNNFGIVTGFTMKTYPQGQVWGGYITFTGDAAEQLKLATLKFMANVTDPKAAVLSTFGYTPTANTSSVNLLLFYDAPTPPASIFEDFLVIPAITTDISTRSFLSLVQAETTESLSGLRAVVHTVAVERYDETFLDSVLNETVFWGQKLGSSSSTFISYGIEPFITSILSHGSAYAYPPDRTKAYLPTNIYCQLTNVAKSSGQDIDHAALYTNYALFDTPLERIYGDNLPKLKQIKAKYDPLNIMGQAGGWKL